MTAQRKKPGIVDTIARTCTIFAILGLATICLALIVNVVLIGFSVLNPPIPDIKRVVVTGLSDEAAKISVEMDIPGRPFADLFHLETQDSTQITVGIETEKKPNQIQELVSVFLPNDININLASSKATKVIINDIELRFHDIKPELLSEIIDFKEGKVMPPKFIQVFLSTRVVTNSLLIPFGMNLKLPVVKKSWTELTKVKSKPVTAAEPNKPNEAEPVLHNPDELSEKTKKLLSAFLPKKVNLNSNSDAFIIEIFESIPVSALPSFLSIKVPQMKFALAYKKPASIHFTPAITFDIDEFAITGDASKNDSRDRVEFGAKIAFSQELVTLAKMTRDEELDDVEISVGVEKMFSGTCKEGSLMKWLSKVNVQATVKEFKQLQKNLSEAKKVAAANNPEETPSAPHSNDMKLRMKKHFENAKNKLFGLIGIKSESGEFKQLKENLSEANMAEAAESPEETPSSPLSNDMKLIMKTLFENVKIKLVGIKNESESSTLEARIRILRKRILSKLGLSNQLLIGQVPNIAFTVSKTARDKEEFKKIMAFRFETNQIKSNHKRIDMKFKLSFFYFLKDVFESKEKVKPADLELAKRAYAEIKDIGRIRVEFSKDENVFSNILNAGNCDIYLTAEMKPEKLQFLGSERVISLLPEKKEEGSEPTDTETKDAPKIVTYAKNHFESAFVAKNEAGAAVIAATFSVVKRVYDSPMRLFASWSNFQFDVLFDDKSLLEFAIQQGRIIIGMEGGIFPVDGGIKFNLRIPSADKNLAAFKKVVHVLLTPEASPDAKDKLVFKVRFGGHGQPFEQKISLQLLKDIKEGKLFPKPPKKAEEATTNKHEETTEPTEVTTKEPEEAADASPKNTHNAEPDLLKELTNSVLQLVSFQAPSLFFHINIPDKSYCSERELENFDTKISASVALPVLEARLCANEVASKKAGCLLRAGLSRPTILSTVLVDGKLCSVKFDILPPTAHIIGFKAIQHITKYDFAANEAPIHVSIENLANLIRFGERAGAKVPQVLTLSSWTDAEAINKIIGEIGSAALKIPLPPPEPKEPKETKDQSSKEAKDETSKETEKEKSKESKDETSKETEKEKSKKIEIVQDKNQPAALNLFVKSMTPQELEMYLEFTLPAFVLDNLATALEKQNLYHWPVVRWGLLEYKLSVPNAFDIDIFLDAGEIDLKPEGVVLAAGKPVKVAFSVKVAVNERIRFGSSALLQILSSIQRYVSIKEEDRRKVLPAAFFKYLANNHLIYEMKTKGSHGLQDDKILDVKGKFPLQQIFDLIDSINHRDDDIGKDKDKDKIDSSASASEEKTPESSENPFHDLLVSLTTLPSPELFEPKVHVPCLIPALCKSPGQTPAASTKQDELNLYIEIKNALQPATKLASTVIGKVLYGLNFSKYPSHFALNCKCMTDLQMTFSINGVGLASVGLAPFEFIRVAEISYPEQNKKEGAKEADGAEKNIAKKDETAAGTVKPIAKDEDKLSLKLSFSLTENIGKFASSLNSARMAYLSSLFTVPPAYFEREADGSISRVKLANPAFNIAFSNDVLLDHDKSSLLATLISGLVGEISTPGINYQDPLSSSKQASKPVSKKEAKQVKTSTVIMQRYPSISSITLAGTCLSSTYVANYFGTFGCDNELSAEALITLPFPPILSFNLPAVTKITLKHDDLPFLQIEFRPVQKDKEPSKRLVIAPGNTQVKALMRLNLFGVDGVHSTDPNKYKNIITHLNAVSVAGQAEKVLPVSIHVQMGDEAGITANLALPLYKLKNNIYKYIGIPGERTAKVPESEQLEISAERKTNLDRFDVMKDVENLSAMQRECIDGNAADKDNPERRFRLSTLALENTALFLKEGHDSVRPGVDSDVFIQLMNSESLPVCGLPSEISKLKLAFIRKAAEQPDIRLISLFSCPVPGSTEVFNDFEAEFLPAFSIFKAKVKLPFAGIYQVKLIYGEKFEKEYEVPNLNLYVRH